MTPVNVCTVITRSRLAHARVLAESFLDHHPDGRITALLVDDLERSVSGEPFEVVHPADVGIAQKELHRMATIYTAYELSGALKPWLIAHQLDSTMSSEVVYLDSDVAVFRSIEDIAALARGPGLLLTPHLTAPPTDAAGEVEEKGRFVGGVYNTGVLVVHRRGRPFLEWWQERLGRNCVLEPQSGYWTDQRWLDLVPSYFRCHILKDPGCNVAFWNLPTRALEWTGEEYRVDGAPLRLFHFARYDPDAPHLVNEHLSVLLSSRPALGRLFRTYGSALHEHGYRAAIETPYAFEAIPGGLLLDAAMRTAYRDALRAAEFDGEHEPPNPFTDGSGAFLTWLREPPDRSAAASGVTRYSRSRKSTGAIDEDGVPAELRVPETQGPSPEDEPGPTSLDHGVNLVFRVRRANALDDVARQIAHCLEDAGIPFVAIGWDDEAGLRDDLFHGPSPQAAPYDTNLVCLNPLDLVGFAFNVPARFFETRCSIGLWLDDSAQGTAIDHAAGFLDEIWVTSEFAADALRSSTAKSVRVFPLPVETASPKLTPGELGLPEDFFLSIVDLGLDPAAARFDHGNPLGLVRVFESAFAPEQGPVIVLRTVNGDRHMAEVEQLRYEAVRSDILVVDGPLTPEERRALISACSCYVSLHRVEEFGVPIAEAIGLGRPVVATGFSGSLALTGGEGMFCVDYDLSTIPENRRAYWTGTHWAEPDLEHAALLVRTVHEHPEEAQAVGATGANELMKRHSAEVASAFLRTRIGDARVRPTQDLLPVASSDTALGGPESALERAEAYIAGGPQNAWGAGSRLGPAGRFARRALLRLLRPYTTRHHELDVAVVEALAELNHRQSVLEQRLAEVDEPRDEPDDRGSSAR